jgi:uncharacterized protein YbbK (DUF523 family)
LPLTSESIKFLFSSTVHGFFICAQAGFLYVTIWSLIWIEAFNMEKIRIGVSTCLLGESVRYDGGHARDRYVTDTLGQCMEFMPVCPEMEAGLGLPREPIRLVGDPESPRVVTINTHKDLTETMTTWAQQRVRELEKEDFCGFIFKSKSPSSLRNCI